MRYWKFAVLAVFIASSAMAQDCSQDIDLEIIGRIESNNNPYAYNPAGGGSHGQYQIHPSCLAAFNRAHKTRYSLRGLYTPSINRHVAWWYLNEEIPRLLRVYRIPVTNRNKIIAYNAGILFLIRGKTPQITLDYIRKYERLCREKSAKESSQQAQGGLDWC